MPILLLIIPVFSTLLGGLLAVRFRRSLTLLTAVGAGLLLGAAFLDLLPEAIILGATEDMHAAQVLGIALISFLVFFSIENALDTLSAHWENSAGHGRTAAPRRMIGRIAGALLIFHSFRDGLAIGVAYAASHHAGYAVAIGIAAHDLGDGMNTIILTTRGKRPRTSDYVFLAADSLAPLAGGLLTAWYTFSVRSTVPLLAIAGGFFLQMAASQFLPEIRRAHTSRSEQTFRPWTGRLVLPAVILGAAVIYIANLLTGNLS